MMMPLSWIYQRPWEDYLTVVQPDQRGAGKTSVSNDAAAVFPTVPYRRMVDDTEEIVEYRRQKCGKEKIFLLGHSRGSALGVEIARAHPDSLYAHIGVGQVVNFQRSKVVGHQALLKEAAARGDKVGRGIFLLGQATVCTHLPSIIYGAFLLACYRYEGSHQPSAYTFKS